MNSSTIEDLSGENGTSSVPYRLPRSEGIAYTVAFIVEFLLIIIGNSIVIAVFKTTRQLRQRKSHWFLINLAIADLLVGTITGPFWLYFLAYRCNLWDYDDNPYAIVAQDSIFLFSLYASLANLALIALERMHATLWPLKHRVLDARNYQVMIGFSWSLPIFLPCVSAAERYKQISLDAFNYIWLSSSCFFFLIIVVCYTSIWFKINYHKQPRHHVTTAQDRRLTVSLFLVTAASLMTLLPGVLFSVIVYSPPLSNTLSQHSSLHTLNSAALLIYASSIVNSIIYSFKLPKFKHAALRLACRRSTSEMRVPAMERRNMKEIINHQACAVIFYSPKPSAKVNKKTSET